MAFDRRETAILLIGDFLILTASLWTALFLRNLEVPSTGYFLQNFVPFLGVFFLSLIVFYIAGLYEKPTRPVRSVMGIRIFGAQAGTTVIAFFLFFILPFSIAPKTILVLYLIVSVVAESMWRFYRMNREIAVGNRERAILVATGPAAHELCEEINGNTWYRIQFSDFLDTADKTGGALIEKIQERIQNGARIIIVDTGDPILSHIPTTFFRIMTDTVLVREFASLYEEIFDRVPIEHIDARQLLHALPRQRVLYNLLKRTFDLILALVLSAVAVPIVAVAALALFIESGNPLIRPMRVGKDGHTFRLLKLRSMLFDDRGDPELQKKNRVTVIGRLLRKTRIDELPQLWNVLMGDLSFIGPRPEIPKIADVYEQEVPLYRMRHLIAPGLSGWAQIHDYDAPRGGADVMRTKRKVSYDLYYLKHRSFRLDLAIAIKTIRAIISVSGT